MKTVIRRGHEYQVARSLNGEGSAEDACLADDNRLLGLRRVDILDYSSGIADVVADEGASLDRCAGRTSIW